MVGSIVITLALICSVISMVMYYYSFRGVKNTLSIARLSFHAMALLVIAAATTLLYLIITNRYDYAYVYNYSSSNLPLGYKISTFWAGQEGSFMLWLLLTSIVGVVLQSYSSKRDDLEIRVMPVFTLTTTFLLLMVSPLFKNPFAYLFMEPGFIDLKNINPSLLMLPALEPFRFADNNTGQSFIKMGPDLFAALKPAGYEMSDLVIQGKGLNPLLQNFWMQIHPPILFLGFALSTVPFVFAMAALMKNDYREWVKQALPWVVTGSGVLGLGIMLGGYWAYGILGWGGYWAWDPVEKASLSPLLIGVASIHTLIVQQKSFAVTEGPGRFARTNLIFSILTYVLVLYGTFLTRSGILGDASVHSFVDPGRLVYIFLIVFVAIFALLGFGAIAYRWKYLNEKFIAEEGILSRELALFTGAVTLAASALVVFVGTSAPIFKQSVETTFYNEMHIPIVIIMGLLNGLSLLIKWQETKGKELLGKLKIPLAFTIVVTAVIALWGHVTEVMMILIIFSALFTLFINAGVAYKIFAGNKLKTGAYIAHIGIALFTLGVVGSSVYSRQADIDLEKGKPVNVLGYTLTFTGFGPIENNTKLAFNIKVEHNGSSGSVNPVMYMSPFNNSVMREPDILYGITKDFYVEPKGYDEGKKQEEQGTPVEISKGENVKYENAEILYKDVFKEGAMGSGDFALGLELEVSSAGKTFSAKPLIKKQNEEIAFTNAPIPEMNLNIKIQSIDPASQKAVILVSKMNNQDSQSVKSAEVLSIMASVKPFISFVWIGVGVMFLGFCVSFFRRYKESVE